MTKLRNTHNTDLHKKLSVYAVWAVFFDHWGVERPRWRELCLFFTFFIAICENKLYNKHMILNSEI